MLSKIEYNCNANWNIFWTSRPEDFHKYAGYYCCGNVSPEELLVGVPLAEEAFCGEGDSCRTADEIGDFAKWLCGLGYTVRVSFEAAAKLAAFHED